MVEWNERNVTLETASNSVRSFCHSYMCFKILYFTFSLFQVNSHLHATRDFRSKILKWKWIPALLKVWSPSFTEVLTYWKANRLIPLSQKCLLNNPKDKIMFNFVKLFGQDWRSLPSPTRTFLPGYIRVTWAAAAAAKGASLDPSPTYFGC